MPADQVVGELDLAWLDACLTLDQRALNGLWTREQWSRELSDPRRLCLGHHDDQAGLTAIACGWLVVDELHITAVAVDPDHRRRGRAMEVLGALLQRARQHGANHATLDVAAENTPAIALYSQFGFRTAGCRKGYYQNGKDALIQWVRLSSSSTNDAHC